MFPALSKTARLSAALIAVIALASVVGMFFHLNTVRAQSYAETAYDMSRFFTILTNIAVFATFMLAALRRNGVYPPWLAALTLAMIMVGGVYHALLSHLTDFSGIGIWSDHGLHTVVPIGLFLWWLAYAPKRNLIFADLPIFTLWPSVYVAYALWRANLDGIYPYPFMDAGELGAAAAAINLAGLTIVLLLGGVVFVTIGRFADR